MDKEYAPVLTEAEFPPNRFFIVKYPAERQWKLSVQYDGDVASLLEKIFGWFNAGSGDECEAFLAARSRSLSVNDFVCVDGQWYQCKSVGWEPVCSSYVSEIDVAVRTHPRYNVGAWFALNEVMAGKRFKL